jgi:hypothetical protein
MQRPSTTFIRPPRSELGHELQQPCRAPSSPRHPSHSRTSSASSLPSLSSDSRPTTAATATYYNSPPVPPRSTHRPRSTSRPTTPFDDLAALIVPATATTVVRQAPRYGRISRPGSPASMISRPPTPRFQVTAASPSMSVRQLPQQQYGWTWSMEQERQPKRAMSYQHMPTDPLQWNTQRQVAKRITVGLHAPLRSSASWTTDTRLLNDEEPKKKKGVWKKLWTKVKDLL